MVQRQRGQEPVSPEGVAVSPIGGLVRAVTPLLPLTPLEPEEGAPEPIP